MASPKGVEELAIRQRNKRELGLRSDDISDTLFAKMVKQFDAKLIRWVPFYVDFSSSILSDLTTSTLSDRIVGLYAFNIDYKLVNGTNKTVAVVLKCKGTDMDVITMLNNVAFLFGKPLAGAFDRYKEDLGFRHTHRRELRIAQLSHPEIRTISPKVYHVWEDEAKEIHAFCMEYLDDTSFSHLTTVNDITMWSEGDIHTVLEGLASFHSLYLAQEDKLENDLGGYLDLAYTTQSMRDKMPLWLALLESNAREFPHIWTPARKITMLDILQHGEDIWGTLEAYPKCLVHNDFNPRNICLRCNPRKLCVYDWELAGINVPQHDLVEFLMFTVDPSEAGVKFQSYSEFYRQSLLKSLQQTVGTQNPSILAHLSPEPFTKVMDYCAFNLLMLRVAMYSMVQKVKEHTFLPRTVDCLFAFIKSRSSYHPFIRLGDM